LRFKVANIIVRTLTASNDYRISKRVSIFRPKISFGPLLGFKKYKGRAKGLFGKVNIFLNTL